MPKITTLPITTTQLIWLCLAFLVIVFIYSRVNNLKGTWSTKEAIEPYLDYSSDPLPNMAKAEGEEDDSEGERICRNFLRTILKRPFNKSRPSILNNPITSQNLEIDCYCPELKLGVEYNGRQHYQYVPMFHKNYEDFRNQQYRDELKRRMCSDNGITLIEVPYKVKHKDIPKYLNDKLRLFGYV